MNRSNTVISTFIMEGLAVIYAVLAVISAVEWNFPRSLYWLGALVINISILWATHGR